MGERKASDIVSTSDPMGRWEEGVAQVLASSWDTHKFTASSV